ncbi:MAG: CvpA family protein [Alphaproteobacteria bacterium]|nr:CvpA family protein [Alphaproteobacteria bacterium]
MAALDLNVLDMVILAVIAISAIFAALRGFVRESLSVLAWFAAAAAAVFFGPWLAHSLHGTLEGWPALIIGYGAIFLAVVIPLSFVSHYVGRNVQQSPIGMVDRLLGALFGAVRGIVIIAVCYLLFSLAVPAAHQPSWMTRARLMPLIRSSSHTILALVPDPRLAGHSGLEQVQAVLGQIRRERSPVGISSSPPAPLATKRPQVTYSAKEREALDRLLEGNGSGKHP